MSMPPADPTLYRFFEMIQVFGYPLKAIIHEKVTSCAPYLRDELIFFWTCVVW